MFGSTVLEVAIAIICIYIVASLAVSSLTEVIASVLGTRSSNLRKALTSYIGYEVKDGNKQYRVEQDPTLSKALEHPLIHSLSKPKLRKSTQAPRGPSYIPKNVFARALIETVLLEEDKRVSAKELETKVQKIKNPELKKVLAPLLEKGVDNIDKTTREIETWFDNKMNRAAGWYKRKAQYGILAVSLLLVSIYNIDSFTLIKYFWNDSRARADIVQMAEQMNSSKEARPDNNEGFEQLRSLDKNSELPVGWMLCDKADTKKCQFKNPGDFWDWLNKIIGLLFTTLMISQGAPFWFDILNKVSNLRGTGHKPENSKPAS